FRCEKYRRRRRCVCQQPPPLRSEDARRCPRDSYFRSESGVVDRQRGHDCRSRVAAAAGRIHLSARDERGCGADALGRHGFGDFVMTVVTNYLYFNTKRRQEFIRITDDVQEIVQASGVKEGMVLVSAMHITAGVYVNDWENGLIEDFQAWLEKLAPAGQP